MLKLKASLRFTGNIKLSVLSDRDRNLRTASKALSCEGCEPTFPPHLCRPPRLSVAGCLISTPGTVNSYSGRKGSAFI